MLTPEQRAEISRQNGAKSKGPVTPEGKARSRRNAISHGRYADVLSLMIPPHPAVLSNEDRQAFFWRLERNVEKYRPATGVEYEIVRKIAEYDWKIERNSVVETAFLNRELMRQHTMPDCKHPELANYDLMIAAMEATAGNPALRVLRRETAGLIRCIEGYERRLLRLKKHFPSANGSIADTVVDQITELEPFLRFQGELAEDETRDIASETAVKPDPDCYIAPTIPAMAYSLCYLEGWKSCLTHHQAELAAMTDDAPEERTQPDPGENVENTEPDPKKPEKLVA